jgi:hypothetical protein
MASKKRLVLFPSEEMDKAKKKTNENGMIRLAARARESIAFANGKVELWPVGATAEQRKTQSVLLEVSKAYLEDVRRAKQMIAAGKLPAEDISIVGFVTTKMWNLLTNGNMEKNIWISQGIHDTVVGADPEFLLFRNDEVVSANEIMTKEGVLGSDGAMAEIRPSPAIEIEDFVKNIRTIFENKALTKKIEALDWKAFCYHKNARRDFPVGGHIHIGNPERVAQISMPDRERFFRTVNKILDELLGIYMIRLDGTDNGCARRTKCTMGRYGYFGEWRTANGRLEYRTLSGMWLAHPVLTACTIGTAKAITDEIFARWNDEGYKMNYVYPSEFNNINPYDAHFKGWSEIPLCKDMEATSSSSRIKSLLDESSMSSVGKKELSTWHNVMRSLSTYNRYGKYIDELHGILSMSANQLAGINRDIKKTWLEGESLT